MDQIECKRTAANRRRLDVENVSVPVGPPRPPIKRHAKKWTSREQRRVRENFKMNKPQLDLDAS